MTKRLFNPASLAAVVLSLAGVAVTACSPDPYPTPVAEEPPPPPPAELAGGPDLPPPPPMETAPLPPPPPAEQAAAPPPGPPVIIAMAPIPNPPEEPRRAPRRARAEETYSSAPSGQAEGVYTYATPEPRPSVSRRERARRRAEAAERRRLALAQPAPQAPAKPASKPMIVSRSPGKVTPPATVARNAKPSVPALTRPAAPGAVAPAAPPAPGGTPGAFHAAQLKNLETALAEVISKTAKLTAPSKLEPGMPAEVSLALPPEFAATVKAEAEKAGLADAASSVNLTAVLSGEGYVVSPGETQSLPLVAGKSTEFRWAVTPGATAEGPLKADLGADLLGGGSDTLNLGSISSSQGLLNLGNNPARLIGYGIFAVIAAVLIAWLLRGRNTPPPRSNAQRRSARRAVRNDKPFDLGDERA